MQVDPTAPSGHSTESRGCKVQEDFSNDHAVNKISQDIGFVSINVCGLIEKNNILILLHSYIFTLFV